jgi:single-strand DNA-binding protein
MVANLFLVSPIESPTGSAFRGFWYSHGETFMGLANISIVGNVVKPPAQTAFANGDVKTTLVVAVNTYKKGAPDNQTAEFYKVDVRGRLADVAYKYVSKGSQITAVGRFSIDRWQGNDGRERSMGVISASEISLPPKRAALEDSSTSDPSSKLDAYPSPPASAATPPSSVATAHGVDPDEFLSEAEEDAAAAEMYSKTLRVPPGGLDGASPFGGTAQDNTSDAANLLDGSVMTDGEAQELFSPTSGAA